MKNLSIDLYESDSVIRISGRSDSTSSVSEELHDVGLHLFLLMMEKKAEDDGDIIDYVKFLCEISRKWMKKQFLERASWCINFALKNEDHMQILLKNNEKPPSLRQKCATQLFHLYLQTIEQESESKHQVCVSEKIMHCPVNVHRPVHHYN